MGKVIQIRNVPEKVHRALTLRATKAGLSLSEYLLREIRRTAERPTRDELIERMRRREQVVLGSSVVADSIREGREEREAQIDAWFDDRH
ncbi:MAG TPA: hypothetical protein VMU84_00715 [Thermoanaerobaculia bacterium]|nr:hypothetical protein [Thermoanaerobaculia bacterium]